MKQDTDRTIRTAVERANAETYLLITLVAFAGSVIATRLFLELSGYPQLGSGVLHIAHALWGGLFLMVAALLPLLLANRWARVLSAIAGGVGVGLFIDEVGKFVTQRNDYFFPPAAPVIYAAFLVLVLLFLFVRRDPRPHPRAEMYRALSSFYELLDNNLDSRELEVLQARLDVARQAGQPHVSGLATALLTYLEESDVPLVPEKPSLFKRVSERIQEWGHRLGQRYHRLLIVLAMVILSLGMVTAVAVPFFTVVSPQSLGERMLAWQLAQVDVDSAGSVIWISLRLILEVLVGIFALVAIFLLATGRDRKGIQAALVALILSLGGVLLLSFYLDQFSATATALLQCGVLFVVIAYQRWYVRDEPSADTS